MQLSEAIKAIKEKISLVDLAGRYLQLRQNGPRYVAPCPFHQETKPSFSINADKGLFYCFGCQASGDLIDFYAKINGLDFRESVLQLAEQAGVVIDKNASPQAKQDRKKEYTEKQAMLAMHRDAALHFKANLSLPMHEESQAYLSKRGLSQEIITHFELGWASRNWHDLEHFLAKRGHDLKIAVKCGLLGASKNGASYDRFRGRLMFPIKDLSSQVIAFGGRIIADEDEAKYINSADTPIYGKKEHLYGLAQARRSISAKGFAYLTEGYMDVLTLHQFNYANSVGVLGTALTEEQIKRLSGFTSTIGLLFDGDGPGRKAALRASELLLSKGIKCFVILLPEGEDIDSLLHGSGPESFDKIHVSAPDGLTFCINCISDMAPKQALEWTKGFLAKIQIPELTGKYASILSQKLGIAENLLRGGIFKASPKTPLANISETICATDNQILIFAVRYPERIGDLRMLGADLLLAHKQSREFWKIIETYGPEESFYYLDEAQKKFWIEKRGPLAPPRNSGDKELACLKQALERYYANSQTSAIQAALARRGAQRNFEEDLEYLQAIRDAMRMKNEQS